jgi:hypothetical protein
MVKRKWQIAVWLLAVAAALAAGQNGQASEAAKPSGARLSGTVLQANGDPLASGTLSLTGAGDPSLGADVPIRDGRYEAEVEPGEYAVRITGGQTGGAYDIGPNMAVYSGEQTVRDFRIPATRDYGQVVKPDGSPWEDGLTLVIRSRSAAAADFPPTRLEVKDGRLAGLLPDGDYAVTQYTTKAGKPVAAYAPFSVPADPSARIVLAEPDVTGTVALGDGRPASGVYLAVRIPNLPAPFLLGVDAAADGTFALSLPDGDYEIDRAIVWGNGRENAQTFDLRQAFTVHNGRTPEDLQVVLK